MLRLILSSNGIENCNGMNRFEKAGNSISNEATAGSALELVNGLIEKLR